MMDGISWYMVGVIALLMLCTILPRAAYMLFGNRFPLPEGVRRALRYAPVAALVAIIVPELLPGLPGEPIHFDVRILAALVAVVLFWRTGSTLAVIVGGMIALWVLQFLSGVGF